MRRLTRDMANALGRKRKLFGNERRQFFAVEAFHRNIGRVECRATVVVNLDDIRMRKATRRLRLALKPRLNDAVV